MTTRYLSPVQVSELTGLTTKTLAAMRYEGRGPRYVKLTSGRSGRVRYDEAAVVEWMQAHEQGGEVA